MRKSYLSSDEDSTLREYIRKQTYLSPKQSTRDNQKYSLLPEEYDVFSEIDPKLFLREDTEQQKLISLCLIYIKEQLISLFLEKGVICVLPKLKYITEENAVILNWAYSGYRVFFSFNNDEMGATAFCGIVVQSDEESVETQMKKLDIKNYRLVLAGILKIVIENS